MSKGNAELIAEARNANTGLELNDRLINALADALEAVEVERDAAHSVISLVREDYLGSGRLTNRGQQALSRATS